MRGLTILVAVGIIAGALGETTETPETPQTPECLKATKEAEACQKQAYENYRTEFTAGDDKKKPAWLARKSCNYLMETVETCQAKTLGVCFTEEELNQQKDEQLVENLEKVRELVKDWDSSKCPVAKAHEERLQAALDAAAAAATSPESDPTGSSTAMTASVLSTLILAIFI